ncbi:hypothetical protein NUH16_008692 [Penicillium rubens]|nr:hypothetical protein NUH16_008692 [Penicillium rubens]
MELERDSSTSSLIALCIRDFHKLLDSIPGGQDNIRLKVQDEMGMLRVWAGNFGAHRRQTDRSSLDHRLREAPDLHREVQNHIRDITEAIQGAISFFSANGEFLNLDDTSAGSEMDELDADDSDSDGFWDQVKAESNEHSRLDEYMLDIQYTIASLYKFSLTLQNPAHRYRTAQVSRIELGHFEFYDIQHVSDEYNIPQNSTLAQRLGKANTKRRQLLAYYKEHTEKTSNYVGVAVQKATKVQGDSTKNTGTQRISTKLTQDDMVYRRDKDGDSDSGETKFSATTSIAGGQAHVSMPPPPPADVVNPTQNQPFICPYCRQTIQLEDMDKDWKYHVYSDLRPYICTFGDCVKSNQLYDSYMEWSEHERQFHRREWICNICSYAFKSEALFRDHLGDTHTGVLPEDQREAVVKLSERSTSSAQQCPLCTTPPISNPSHFQQHLAQHLRELSLFVLPHPDPEENEDAAREGESNEFQQVVVIDDHGRTSWEYTSTNQNSSVMERDQTLSEGSESHDKLESPEAENQPVTQGQVDNELREMENNKRILGLEHTLTVESMNRLVSTYWKRGQLEEAANLLEQVPAIRNTKLGEDHSATLTNMSDIACSYKSQGNWVEALKFDLKMFEKKKLMLGPRHFWTLDAMNDIADSYANLGRYEEEELIARQLVDIAGEVLSPTDDSLLIWKMSLVSTYRNQGKLDHAKNLGQEVATTCQVSFGMNDPLTLTALVSLASTYQDQARWSDAEDLGKEVVRISEIVHGETHPETLVFMRKLCYTIRNQGHLEEAKDLGEKAISGMEKAGMGRDRRMIVAMVDLAVTYRELRLMPEAEALVSRALHLMEEIFGKDHPQTISAMLDLSVIYQSQNKLDAARELAETVLARRERIFGRDHPDTVEALENFRNII